MAVRQIIVSYYHSRPPGFYARRRTTTFIGKKYVQRYIYLGNIHKAVTTLENQPRIQTLAKSVLKYKCAKSIPILGVMTISHPKV